MLEKQFRVFQLTKYAQFSQGQPSSQSTISIRAEPPPLAMLTSSRHTSNCSSDLQGSYIPPHRRRELSTPRASLDHKAKESPIEAVPSISLFGDCIEDAWTECQESGIYAIWCGLKKDLLLLSNWLEDNSGSQEKMKSGEALLNRSLEWDVHLVQSSGSVGMTLKFFGKHATT